MGIADTLRKEVVGARSLKSIATATGIPYSSVHGFAHGRDVLCSTADVLAEHFGLELREKAHRKKRQIG